MEIVYFSETLVTPYKYARRQNQKEQYHHPHGRENLKSHNFRFTLRPSILSMRMISG
jgi:hypothetical protein